MSQNNSKSVKEMRREGQANDSGKTVDSFAEVRGPRTKGAKRFARIVAQRCNPGTLAKRP